MNQNEFACFDIETLERATIGDGGTEAHLTLCSIACCDTIVDGGGGGVEDNEQVKTWFRVIGNSRDGNEKQRLGIILPFFYYNRARALSRCISRAFDGATRGLH